MATNPSPERTRGGLLRPRVPGVRPPPSRLLPGATGAVAQEPPRASLSALSVACERHADLVLVALRGELDTYTVPGFQERVRHLDPAEVQMVIDLAGVGLLDAAGLGALVRLRNEASRGGAPLGIICPESRLVRVFWVTGLRPAFVLGDDLAAVRAALPARRARAVRPGGR